VRVCVWCVRMCVCVCVCVCVCERERAIEKEREKKLSCRSSADFWLCMCV